MKYYEASILEDGTIQIEPYVISSGKQLIYGKAPNTDNEETKKVDNSKVVEDIPNTVKVCSDIISDKLYSIITGLEEIINSITKEYVNTPSDKKYDIVVTGNPYIRLKSPNADNCYIVDYDIVNNKVRRVLSTNNVKDCYQFADATACVNFTFKNNIFEEFTGEINLYGYFDNETVINIISILKIDTFYIHPYFRNQSIGSKLLSKIKILTNITLVTYPLYRALPFYINNGFIPLASSELSQIYPYISDKVDFTLSDNYGEAFGLDKETIRKVALLIDTPSLMSRALYPATSDNFSNFIVEMLTKRLSGDINFCVYIDSEGLERKVIDRAFKRYEYFITGKIQLKK